MSSTRILHELLRKNLLIGLRRGLLGTCEICKLRTFDGFPFPRRGVGRLAGSRPIVTDALQRGQGGGLITSDGATLA